LSCRIGHFGEKKKNRRGLAQSLSLVLLMSGVLLMSELLQKSELLLMSKVLLMSVFVLCVESTQKCL
jgi:Zn-dependent membrane protease YugP